MSYCKNLSTLIISLLLVLLMALQDVYVATLPA